MDKLDELLISHDELHIVCKAMMSIILERNLQDDLEEKLKEAKITPGFAERAMQIEEQFTQRRRVLMATGRLQ